MSDMKEILEDFDEYLTQRKLKFEGIIVGGAALLIMDVVKRVTRDADILDPCIPENIKMASEDFAETYKKEDLDFNWFNDSAYAFSHSLPSGWRMRTEEIFKGKSLTFQTLGREDFLKTKVYAYCNRGADLDDLISLEITDEEIENSIPWVKERMPENLFGDQVEVSIETLRDELGIDNDLGLEME